MVPLRVGIVGTGYIARALARRSAANENVVFTSVSSRARASANAFAARFTGMRPAVGIEELTSQPDVDAVFVATPTAAKESLALSAIAAGKHVLVDKPFESADSVRRIAQAARTREVCFMDGTHFVHHPRTKLLKERLTTLVGSPRSLHASFHIPFTDADNIRLTPSAEPMGAVGDLAWYAMRAIVEYLSPGDEAATVAVSGERDIQTGACIRAAGFLSFASGESASFDVAYTSGTVLQDLQIVGTDGEVFLNDFVLDQANSIAFSNAQTTVGFRHRSGFVAPRDATFVPTPSNAAQDVLMFSSFAELVRSNTCLEPHARTLRTQTLLDAIWRAFQGDDVIQ